MYRMALFSGPPPNFTKSQALYKFLYLENLGGGGQFSLYRAWGLVKLGGGAEKRAPLYMGFFVLLVFSPFKLTKWKK